MPANRVRVQVAFQGGGAKLIALLAAVDALKRRTDLEINSVAGTSAGAIAACVFAASRSEPDLTKVRQHLRDKGQHYLRSLSLPAMSWWNPAFTWPVFRGRPLVAANTFRSIFEEFFSIFPDKPRTFGDLKPIEVRVTATDLLGAAPRIYGERDADSIVEALEHSCGLPFLFKGVDDQYVDGGLCENLPVDILRDRRAADGEILAISFKDPTPKRATSVGQFALSLFAAAINNSVSRASKGAFSTHGIDTHIQTFDFKTAVEPNTLGDHYENVVRRVSEWLDSTIPLLKDQSKIARGKTAAEAPSLTARLFNVYDSILKSDVKMHKMTLCVKANCLLPELRDGEKQADEIVQEFVVEPVASDLRWLAVHVSDGVDPDDETLVAYNCSDSAGSERALVTLPMVHGETGTQYALLVFHPALETNQRYRIRQKEVLVDAMIDLKNKNRDFLGWRPAWHAAVEAELQLLVPRDWPQIKPQTRRDPRGRVSVPGHQPANIVSLLVPSPLFRCIAWRADGGVGEAHYFGVDFVG